MNRLVKIETVVTIQGKLYRTPRTATQAWVRAAMLDRRYAAMRQVPYLGGASDEYRARHRKSWNWYDSKRNAKRYYEMALPYFQRLFK